MGRLLPLHRQLATAKASFTATLIPQASEAPHMHCKCPMTLAEHSADAATNASRASSRFTRKCRTQDNPPSFTKSILCLGTENSHERPTANGEAGTHGWLSLLSFNQDTPLVDNLKPLGKIQVGKIHHRQGNLPYALIRKSRMVSKFDSAGGHHACKGISLGVVLVASAPGCPHLDAPSFVERTPRLDRAPRTSRRSRQIQVLTELSQGSKLASSLLG